jgi:hypothetical protein
MKKRIIAVATGLILSIVARETDGAKQNKEPADRLASAGSPDELAERLDTLLSNCRRSDLDRLVVSSDGTAAVAAGWERVRRTLPETEDDPVSPDMMAVSRFLGLVEGRLLISVPKGLGREHQIRDGTQPKANLVSTAAGSKAYGVVPSRGLARRTRRRPVAGEM